MMFEPIRGGTRGGQGEFKWSDVSADKDRENYLGHSINAPTGRWQKNKDVHWYNRELKDTEEERQAEIRKIKEAEEDALAVALGFAPAQRTETSSEHATAGASVTTVAEAQADDMIRQIERAERRKRKLEKRARKEEKRAQKEMKALKRRRSPTASDEDTHHDRHRVRRPSSLPRSTSRKDPLDGDASPNRSRRYIDCSPGYRHTSPSPPRRERYRHEQHRERSDEPERRRR